MVAAPMVPIDRCFIHIVALIDAEHAFDAADHAADRCADDRADRAGDAVALMETMRGAAGNALRLGGKRHSERRDKRTGNKHILFHKVTSVFIEERRSV